MTGASPALASCGSTSTEAYVDCTAELGTIAPLGVINANNWDFGPRNYGIFYNGQLIGTTSNYIHGHTAGRDAQNDNGYIAWASGPRIRQQIYVRIFDDTFGNTVTSATHTASSFGTGVFISTCCLADLTTGHSYHFTWRWSVWVSGYPNKFVGPLLTGGTIFCPKGGSCYFHD